MHDYTDHDLSFDGNSEAPLCDCGDRMHPIETAFGVRWICPNIPESHRAQMGIVGLHADMDKLQDMIIDRTVESDEGDDLLESIRENLMFAIQQCGPGELMAFCHTYMGVMARRQAFYCMQEQDEDEED